jgi:hypothetical protein
VLDINCTDHAVSKRQSHVIVLCFDMALSCISNAGKEFEQYVTIQPDFVRRWFCV